MGVVAWPHSKKVRTIDSRLMTEVLTYKVDTGYHSSLQGAGQNSEDQELQYANETLEKKMHSLDSYVTVCLMIVLGPKIFIGTNVIV